MTKFSIFVNYPFKLCNCFHLFFFLFGSGEMSHHEVLDAVAKGTSVILSDHSNSERGYLSVFKEKLMEKLGHTVSVVISESDRDPLQVV